MIYPQLSLLAFGLRLDDFFGLCSLAERKLKVMLRHCEADRDPDVLDISVETDLTGMTGKAGIHQRLSIGLEVLPQEKCVFPSPAETRNTHRKVGGLVAPQILKPFLIGGSVFPTRLAIPNFPSPYIRHAM
jgi:hypothetical protein